MALSDKLSSALNVFLVGLLIYNLFFKASDRPKNLELGVKLQTELTESGKLHNSTGQLTEVGWSRKYLKEFDANEIYPVIFGLQFFKPLKYKKFDMYNFFFDDKLLQVAASNLYYAGNVFVNFFDFETKTFTSFSQDFLPFVNGKEFPNILDNIFSCQTSGFIAKKGDIELEVSNSLNNNVCLTSLRLKAGETINANIVSFRNVNHDALFEILPISENNRYFYYNLKDYNSPCAGKAVVNDKAIELDRSSCLATHDFGRGVFEYKTSWNFGMGNGRLTDKTPFAINFGSGIAAKTSQSVEDSFKIGEKIYKLNPLEVIHDDRNLMNGVTLKTSSHFAEETANAAEIVFQSYYTTTKSDNFLVIMSKFRYIYGKFSGWVSDDNGVITNFEDIPGFIEFVNIRW